jgi:hypothetical protein
VGQFPISAFIRHLAQTLNSFEQVPQGQKQRPSDAILIVGPISSIS